MTEATTAGYTPFWGTVRRFGNSFRRRRNVALAGLIERVGDGGRAPIRCLDVGGSPIFWDTVDPGARSRLDLTLLNQPGEEHTSRFRQSQFREYRFEYGDARDLSALDDGAYDLVISNSVIEHLGGWSDIQRGCREIRRVGRFGWVQTPAFWCFWEPHAQLPFVHWLATPIRARLVARLSFGIDFGAQDVAAARAWAEDINLLTKWELKTLFPAAAVEVERFLLWPKSYIVTWTP